MMNKRILFVSAVVTVLLCGCQSSKVKIRGRFVGNDATTVYLEQVTPLKQSVIDSVLLDGNGDYRIQVRAASATPLLYNLIYNGVRIPLFVAGGDRITVSSMGNVVRNYTINGSEESELLRKFYQPYVEAVSRLDGIVAAYGKSDLTDEARKELTKVYTSEYYRIRREQLRFIIENKEHLAAVYALYQRPQGEIHLFNGDNDVIYYRTVAEAIEKSYPESPYLAALNAEVARMDARMSLASQITEVGYPDLELLDMYGQKVRLSSLHGKVVLLDFWSAALGSSNALNAELRKIYKRYADSDRGFEVYQVGVDTSKPQWITAVQDQQLPWISVSDLRGEASPSLGLYNVHKLPTNFLIDSEGTIVARDIYGKDLEQKLDQLTR